MPARVIAALFALVAALPSAHDPAPPIASAERSTAQCPAYAALGPNGQPAVPLATVRAERLAPLETPTGLVVCRYRGTTVLQLTGSRQVRSGLGNAGAELALSPRSMGGPLNCRAIAGQHTPYLIGLRYSSGVQWVTTAYDANGCGVASNGGFTSASYVGTDVEDAFATGIWEGDFGPLECGLTTPGCG